MMRLSDKEMIEKILEAAKPENGPDFQIAYDILKEVLPNLRPGRLAELYKVHVSCKHNPDYRQVTLRQILAGNFRIEVTCGRCGERGLLSSILITEEMLFDVDWDA